MQFSTKNFTRLLWLIIIILAFSAGYFQSALEVEQRKGKTLEQKILKLEKQLEESKV